MESERVIKKRNIVLCIILSLITCSLYGMYWDCCLADDVNAISGHEDNTPGWKVIVFSLITCGIYYLYWMYKLGTKLDEAAGNPSGNKGILFLIVSILGLSIIPICIAQSEVNKHATEVTAE